MFNEREFYYEYYCKQYCNDKETLEELEYLYNNFKDFDFSRFSKGMFKRVYIEAYGADLTFKAASKFKQDSLEYGLLNKENYDKVKFYLENDDLTIISESIVLSNEISLDDIKKIKELVKNPDMASVLKSNIRNIEKFKLVINNKNYLNNFEFLANYFEMFFIPENLFDIVCEPEFTNFIKNIDASYITSRTHISDFLKMYNATKKYYNKNLGFEEKEIVNNYAFNANDYNFILDENNIMDFYNQREKNIDMFSNFMKPEQLKEFISKVYFNRTYKKTLEILEDTKILLDKKNINDDKFNYLYSFKYLEEIEELKEFIKGIKKDTNLAVKLVNIGKKLSKESMADKLSGFVIIKGRETIKLTGEEFYMLVHKIKGFGNQKLASELYQDPSIWTKNYDPYSYISTSAISDKHIGICDGNGYVIGFNNIKPEYILAMGPLDILTDTKMVKNGIDNLKIRYMDPDDLVNQTGELYNEVVLKRYIEEKPVMPDFVVAVDNKTSKDDEVSKYFDIPIYEINSSCYAKKMIDLLEHYLETCEFRKASQTILSLAKGFINCPLVRNSYLSLSKLEARLNSIVHTYLNSKNVTNEKSLELLEFIKEYDKVVRIMSYVDYSYQNVDTETAKNAVLKNITK